MPSNDDLIHLRHAGVSLVLATGGGLLPRIVHWGADLGEVETAELAALYFARRPPMEHNLNDQVWDISVLPDFAHGWVGRPGIQGSRGGRDWSPSFRTETIQVERSVDLEDGRRGDAVRATGHDESAGLGVLLEIELLETGLLRARATLTNERPNDPYTVEAIRLVLPVGGEADELLDFTGRHLMERAEQRSSFPVGLHSREMRGGRTGLDAAGLLAAGRKGFGYRAGELWASHLAFSGNQELYAERTYNGARSIGGGELLQSGEVILDADERYTSPWLYGAHSAVGLDAMSARFHEHVRSRPGYRQTPQRVIVNSWEAVYFEHDLEVLGEIAEIASDIGVERFVLDDGWFGSRRDDRSGLGDWTVSTDVWPNGLQPLIDRVHALGMDFGLWVEPEMINLDSDLARAHPDWIFSAGGREGFSSRNQHVLDLTHPEAYEHILNALDRLLIEYDIAYLKWDHNRQLVEAGHQPSGRPAIHGQTLAVYRLMDELHRRHPGLEIESCASGGGRIDLEMLDHTDRVWGSDTNDPLERQRIHRGLGLLVPPELIGAHVGASPSHTTSRMHDLQFRAETAFWKSFGIEIDLRNSSHSELSELASWVEFHKQQRPLIHHGETITVDSADDSVWVSGVVSPDRSSALFGVAMMSRPATWPPGMLRLPGLSPDRHYRVSVCPITTLEAARPKPPAWVDQEVILSGRALEMSGVQLVPLAPEHAYLLSIESII
ncbi:alpha-galactosidase [Leifsonia sp. NPDC056665]|uniref:alpha-galactosidase n=1 Tax=Leifsonia sp. NPDC056665 TaxID=3345901 RepID=UPI00368591C8